MLAIFFLSIFMTNKGYSFHNFMLLSFAIGLIIAPTTATHPCAGSVLDSQPSILEAAE